MMQILVKISKKYSKHVTCLGILPAWFIGKADKRALDSFNQSWEVINKFSDESSIFNFDSTNIIPLHESDSILEWNSYYSLRWNSILNQLADIESYCDSYDYFS